ncbi:MULTISPECIES: TnsA-like heteromeric transposase endonuclease subunit [Streptomyces]|uniref:TnsA-like heteromeric transposase endonuclease subunit n=1 Tax=Streptomyces TaxID=1883 RepID=UPI0005ED082A|nr:MULTISPECIES: TnsA-like heteromeric transposase endonuclease subunit [Streptomyces]
MKQGGLADTALPRGDDFEVSWRNADGEHRCPLTEADTVEFEAGLPVRGFPSYRGQRHFPGLYWSATTGGHVGFESWLERDHAMLLDFTPQVTGLLSQPLWLFWEDDQGKRVSHAPDYFARFEDGRGLVVDCRPLDRIDARSAAKFAAAQAACEAVGWGYRVVGEVDPVRMVNVRWLAGYRHPRHGADDGLAARLLALFSVPSPLVARAALLGDPIAVLPTVFHLLWLGQLTADLSHPLSDATLVSRTEAR